MSNKTKNKRLLPDQKKIFLNTVNKRPGDCTKNRGSNTGSKYVQRQEYMCMFKAVQLPAQSRL